MQFLNSDTLMYKHPSGLRAWVQLLIFPHHLSNFKDGRSPMAPGALDSTHPEGKNHKPQELATGSRAGAGDTHR